MAQIRITSLIGQPPIDIYISDFQGNNKTFLGTITGTTTTITPPIIYQSVPEIFNNMTSVQITLVDGYGNEKSKIVDGTFGCGFNVIFQEVGCNTEFIINNN